MSQLFVLDSSSQYFSHVSPLSSSNFFAYCCGVTFCILNDWRFSRTFSLVVRTLRVENEVMSWKYAKDCWNFKSKKQQSKNEKRSSRKCYRGFFEVFWQTNVKNAIFKTEFMYGKKFCFVFSFLRSNSMQNIHFNKSLFFASFQFVQTRAHRILFTIHHLPFFQ